MHATMLRVTEILKASGETLADFSRYIGVSPQNVNQWKTRGIPRDKLEAVANFANTTIDYILTGKKGAITDCNVAPDPAEDLTERCTPAALKLINSVIQRSSNQSLDDQLVKSIQNLIDAIPE